MKEPIHNDYIEDVIYPLTVIADRYGGAYSGGAYTAWNLDPWEVPKGVDGDDVECMSFWFDNKILYGKGRTVSEALGDLYIKLKRRSTDEMQSSKINE